MKKTLVLGASLNPERYSNKAAKSLLLHGHEIVLVGKDSGSIDGFEISHELSPIKDLDTITLYLNPTIQQQYYEAILAANPKRIIFNPGTENQELKAMAEEKGIQTDEACTLVLLATGQY